MPNFAKRKNVRITREGCVVPGFVRLPLPAGMGLFCRADNARGRVRGDDAPEGFKISYICVWMAGDAGVAEKKVK